MSTFAAFFRAALQQQLTYRIANWAGLFTNTFFLFFRAYILMALYAHRDAIGGMGVHEAVTYAAVTQAILMVVPQWGVIGVASQVHSGQIAVELLRPVDFYGMVMARRLGVSAYYVGMRMLPIFAIAAAAGLLVAPDPVAALGFACSVLLGAWIANTLLFVVELSSFWLESERGIRLLVLGASILPSGLLLPLPLFPEPLQTLFRLTPFPYTMNLPAELWLGLHPTPYALAVQLAWAVGLTVLARWGFERGTRRLLVAGG